jgi:hypothetical protein
MKRTDTPEWAQRFEDWGKRMEAKYGSSNSSNDSAHEKSEQEPLSNSSADSQEAKAYVPQWRRDRHPLGDIFGQFISFLIITYAPRYFPDFFQPGYAAVYTILLISIFVHVAVDLVQFVFNSKPIYYLGQVITNIAGVISMIVMVSIFPFNFPGTLGTIVQFALWIAIVIVSIVTVFQFFQIFAPDWEMK